MKKHSNLAAGHGKAGPVAVLPQNAGVVNQIRIGALSGCFCSYALLPEKGGADMPTLWDGLRAPPATNRFHGKRIPLEGSCTLENFEIGRCCPAKEFAYIPLPCGA